MKTIVIPKPIMVSFYDKESENKEMLFHEMIFGSVLPDAKFGKDMKSILSAVSIKTALIKAVEKNEEEFVLDDVDWALLKTVVEEPTNGYNPAIVMQLTPFLLAITEAK